MDEMRTPSEMDEMLDAVADEFLQAVEKKDKKMMLDALQALVLHIQDMDQDMDQEQDAGSEQP